MLPPSAADVQSWSELELLSGAPTVRAERIVAVANVDVPEDHGLAFDQVPRGRRAACAAGREGPG
jgi:hypothetical protein